MAYPDPIDAATPSDADISGQGDDKIREFKRAVRQRLASFFVDPDADPLVPKANSIPDSVFAIGSFNGARIAVDSIPYDRLQPAPGAGTAPANSVGTAALQDGSVTEPKLGPAAVTTSKIADGNITGPKMAANSVNTANVVDSSVTRSKLLPATRAVLARIQSGTYVYPPGSNLYSAGPDYLRVNINLDTNDKIGKDAMAFINLVPGSTVGPWTGSGLVFSFEIINPTGIQEILQVRCRNMDNSDIDISGLSFHWMVVQFYDGATPE